jgi:hypothetical protein
MVDKFKFEGLIKILTDLKIKSKTAGIPNGCAMKEDTNSNRKKYPIDLPSPQPGQYDIPRLSRGQSV